MLLSVIPNPPKFDRTQKACETRSQLGRGILKDFLYFGLRTLNAIIPKNNNQILFASLPDYSDNAKALYEYVVTNQLHQGYDIVWLVNDPEVLQILTQKGIKTYLERSVLGLYSIFRSKYIIGTHNHCSRIKAKNQYLVNLWHGAPLKSMGYTLKSMGYTDGLETEAVLKDVKRGAEADNMLTVTSSITRNAMVTSFLIDPRKVVVTGQPRNDYLFGNSNTQKLARLLNRDISKYNKLLIYMPTFRVGYGSRVNGTTEHLDFLRSEHFNRFLRDYNMLFVLKVHPFEEKYWLSQDSFKLCSENIAILKTECLTTNLVSVYEVLKNFDILITDYSSIYFDFLLLNRPIIFLPLDLDEYAQTRGFLLEPYDFWAPGPKVTTVEMLIEEIQKCISDPAYYERERNTINNLINHYQDGNSCERVWKEILHMTEEHRKR